MKKAFSRERDATHRALKKDVGEPTRSVLLRSAATLALRCGEYREAEKLVACALSGEPPAEIAEELRDVLENVSFARHLDLHGQKLEPDELQMSISGEGIAHGVAPSEEFVGRIDTVKKLVIRTGEQKEGKPYRDRSGPPGEIGQDYRVFISVPRAASFAVTLKLGRSQERELFPDAARKLIDELLTRLELFDKGDHGELRKLIPDAPYFTNFFSLAKKLAPSGEAVSQVGFTAMREGKERQVALRRPRSTLRLPSPKGESAERSERCEVRGALLHASALKPTKKEIKLLQPDGKEVSVRVREGMGDIVGSYWESEVIVEGIRLSRNVIELEDIRSANEHSLAE